MFLLEHHMQPEFEYEAPASIKNDTHVPFDLGIPEMEHLIKCPSGSKWFGDCFRRACFELLLRDALEY